MAMQPRSEESMPIPPPTGNESDSESSEESGSGSSGQVQRERDEAGVGQGVGSRGTMRMGLDDTSGFASPPTPRITEAHDVGEIYTNLIQDCNSLASNDSSNKDFCEFMSDNLQVGRKTFDFMTGTSTSFQQSMAGVRRSKVGPGDMYLALQHTKVASDLIRVRAERIGSGPSFFSVDAYLDSLKQEFSNKNGEFFPEIAASNIAFNAMLGSKTAVPIVSLFGNYDPDAVAIPTPKKAGPKRSIPMDEESQEGTSVKEGSIIPVAENNPAENVAKGLHNILKTVCRQSPEPVNLFEFVFDRSSFPKTIENLFYFSFLVQDGNVSITKEENGRLNDLSLNIKPEESQNLETESPDDEGTARNQTTRSTYIVSFSAKQFKELAAMCQGESTVSYFQSLMEQ